MNITNVFPIPIMTVNVPNELIEDTLSKTLKFIQDTDFCHPAAPGELLTTYYKDEKRNFLGNIDCLPLLKFINTEIRKYLDVLGYNPKCYVEITSWLQFNQPGSDFVRHDHYGAIVSGVVYLQVPENSGDILFHNPLEARRCTQAFFQRVRGQENDYNFNHVKVPSIKGEMLIFESWLQHTVQENKSKENRISVGFNIWVDSENVKS